ncbi:hypothetical protein AAW14_32500 [Streptomyces hygroscopicus]|nr:hypothetical protein [Streptomyces hygroscopicus]
MEFGSVEACPGSRIEDGGGGRVGRAVGELAGPADVFQVGVGEYDARFSLERLRNVLSQSGHAQARVDDDVAVRSA